MSRPSLRGALLWGALLLPALFAALLIGCGGGPLSLRPGPRTFTPSDYESIYGRWTRNADEFAFGRLATMLHVTATFESWEFRWAYVVRYAADYSLETEERTRILRATLQDARERHRFFVTLAGSRFRESDLTHPRGAWRVLLIDEEGRQTRPLEITRVRRPSAAQRIYFPSISEQRQTFRVAFATRHNDGTPTISPTSDRFFLRFTGAEGSVDLTWDLEPFRASEAADPDLEGEHAEGGLEALPDGEQGSPEGAAPSTGEGGAEPRDEGAP